MDDRVRLEPLFTSDAIEARLDAMAHEIAGVMPKDFVAVAILKGSFINPIIGFRCFNNLFLILHLLVHRSPSLMSLEFINFNIFLINI